tara:strand:+ start:4804 stop:5316 length:513 start_codon:yes stop_codon:yes gene_type:complete
MNPELLIARLSAFVPGLVALLDGMSDQDARWRPSQGGWSIIEILNHLIDEEVEDFRARLELVISDPERPWPVIEPEAAAEERGYNERDLKASIQRLTLERTKTINWLKSLISPPWSAKHQHPTLGPISAGDLLVSLCAHDALHLRQLATRFHDLVQRDAPGFSTDYAGPW